MAGTSNRFLDDIARLATDAAGRVSVEAMRRMNRAVDVEHRDPPDVVREFLDSRQP